MKEEVIIFFPLRNERGKPHSPRPPFLPFSPPLYFTPISGVVYLFPEAAESLGRLAVDSFHFMNINDTSPLFFFIFTNSAGAPSALFLLFLFPYFPPSSKTTAPSLLLFLRLSNSASARAFSLFLSPNKLG